MPCVSLGLGLPSSQAPGQAALGVNKSCDMKYKLNRTLFLSQTGLKLVM